MDNLGFLGMKGLVDLRVANILTKQAVMQHDAATFQNRIAQHEADNSAWYTARADKLEEASNNGMYDPDDPARSTPTPFDSPESSVWYSPWNMSFLSKGKDDSYIIDRLPRPVFSSTINSSISLIQLLDKRRLSKQNFEFL